MNEPVLFMLCVESGQMKDINSSGVGILDDVQNDGKRKQLLIPSDLEGRRCPHCGSRRYFLVFRMIKGRDLGLLAARCSRCRRPRSLMPHELLHSGICTEACDQP